MDATQSGAACRIGAAVTVIADGDVQCPATVGDGDLDALGAAGTALASDSAMTK